MRLIDADALIGKLHEWDMQDLYLPCNFEDMIEEQPTAYDVSKVVAELEEEKTMAYDKCDGGSSYKAYSQAIDIVRKGGTE